MDQFEGPVRQAECGGFYRYMPVTPCSVHVSLSTHSLGLYQCHVRCAREL